MKLIDKDALVAEIESLLDKGKYHEKYFCAYRDGNNGALYALKGKVNSLEVKEVDFEKIWKEYFKYSGDVATVNIKHLAKYFFELGMSVSNKAQKEVDLEKDVRQILSLYYEGIKYYEDIIRKEREENGGSDLAIKIMDGVVDARELSIQYVIDKRKAQKGE